MRTLMLEAALFDDEADNANEWKVVLNLAREIKEDSIQLDCLALAGEIAQAAREYFLETYVPAPQTELLDASDTTAAGEPMP